MYSNILTPEETEFVLQILHESADHHELLCWKEAVEQLIKKLNKAKRES